MASDTTNNRLNGGVVGASVENSGTTPAETTTFTASGTWSKPASATTVDVVVCAGGGGGMGDSGSGGGGGIQIFLHRLLCKLLILLFQIADFAIFAGFA